MGEGDLPAAGGQRREGLPLRLRGARAVEAPPGIDDVHEVADAARGVRGKPFGGHRGPAEGFRDLTFTCFFLQTQEEKRHSTSSNVDQH